MPTSTVAARCWRNRAERMRAFFLKYANTRCLSLRASLVYIQASMWYRAAYDRAHNHSGLLSFGWIMADVLHATVIHQVWHTALQPARVQWKTIFRQMPAIGIGGRGCTRSSPRLTTSNNGTMPCSLRGAGASHATTVSTLVVTSGLPLQSRAQPPSTMRYF